MKIVDKIRGEKLKYDINRSIEKHQKYQHYHTKNDKCEHILGKEILFSDQRRVIEQAYLLSFRKSI